MAAAATAKTATKKRTSDAVKRKPTKPQAVFAEPKKPNAAAVRKAADKERVLALEDMVANLQQKNETQAHFLDEYSKTAKSNADLIDSMTKERDILQAENSNLKAAVDRLADSAEKEKQQLTDTVSGLNAIVADQKVQIEQLLVRTKNLESSNASVTKSYDFAREMWHKTEAKLEQIPRFIRNFFINE